MAQHFLRRGRRFGLGETSGPGAFDPLVSTWAAQVATNGGATPSIGTQSSVNTFVKALTAAGIIESMSVINCMVPDSLTACLTPLIAGPGSNPWVGHSLVATDLTVTGIQGDGSSKYIDTGLIPTAFNPTTNIGVSTYVPDCQANASANIADNGVISTSNSSANFDLLPAITSIAVWDTGGTATGFVNVAINLNGFYSGNRVSASDSRLYFGNSTNAVAQHGSTAAGASNTPLSNSIYILAAHDMNGNVANLYSNRHTSFYAIHRGLTLAQVGYLFSAVQTLRVNLGGGFA